MLRGWLHNASKGLISLTVFLLFALAFSPSGIAAGTDKVYFCLGNPHFKVTVADLPGATVVTLDPGSLDYPYYSATGCPVAMAIDAKNRHLYFSDPHSTVSKIFKRSLSTAVTEEFITGVQAECLAVDPTNGWIFYSERTTRALVRARLSDGGGPEALYTPTTGLIKAMAIDPVGGYLYFSAPGSSLILRLGLTATTPATFKPGVYASGLAVDSLNRRLYYTDLPAGQQDFYVKRISLSSPNEDPLAIYTTGNGSPNTLAVDPAHGYVYFSDVGALVSKVFRCGLDGSGCTSLMNDVYVSSIVLDVNSPPTMASSAGLSIDEDAGATTITPAMLRASDLEQGAASLTFTVGSTTSMGVLSKSGTPVSDGGTFTQADINGSLITYTPDAEESGADSFTFTVSDGAGGSTSGTFSIAVNSVNDPPVLAAIDDSFSRNEGTALTFTASATDVETAAEDLTFSLVGTPTGASIDASTGAFSWTPAEDQGPNSHTFKVRVTDDGSPAEYDEEQITVTVGEVNVAPVLASIGNKSVEETVALTFTASATDLDVLAQSLSFSLVGAPTDASINASTGAFSWTPGEALGETQHTFTVEVTDGALSDSEEIAVTVADTNATPTLDHIEDQSVAELATLTFSAVGLDSDLPAQALTYSLVQTPLGCTATINASSGAFEWTPAEADGPGSYTFTVRVTDNGDLPEYAEDTFTVTVSESNSAPVFEAMGDLTVDELTEIALDAEASDPDLPAQQLTFSLTGEMHGATIDQHTGEVSWTPTEAQGGDTYSLTVRVTDAPAPGAFDEQVVRVTVREVNSAPTLTLGGPYTIPEGQPFSFTADGHDTDDPGQTLAYALIEGPDGSTFDPLTQTFSWTPTEGQGPDDYVVTIVVTDSDALAPISAVASVAIHVEEDNQFPVLEAIGNRTAVEGSPVTFEAKASDQDAPEHLTFSLAGSGVPSGAEIHEDSGIFSWTPGEEWGNQSAAFKVVVMDLYGGSDDEEITIAVAEVNSEPVLGSIGNNAVNELSSLTFTASASDPDLPKQGLLFSLVEAVPGQLVPSGASVDAYSGAFAWTPSESQGPGEYTFTVRIRDNGTPALTDEETITVSVSEVNTAPILEAISNRTVDELTKCEFTASATDADLPAQTLTYSLVGGPAGGPAGAIIGGASGKFEWTPTEAQGPGPGPYTFIVRVTDSLGGIADQSVTITVWDINAAPVLGSVGSKTINELSALAFTASASDPDFPGQALEFSLVGVPNAVPVGASIDKDTGVFAWTPTEAQGPGTYTFTVQVEDDWLGPLAGDEQITVTVSEVNSAPAITPIVDKEAVEGYALTFPVVASDSDEPAQGLTFSLVGEPGPVPAGASINSGTGLFSWTPTEAQGPATHSFTIRVTDGGLPAYDVDALSTNETLNVKVYDPPALIIDLGVDGLDVVEGSVTDQYSVSLTCPPTHAVTIDIGTADTQTTVSPAALMFTAGNFDAPQTVTVTAEDDTAVERDHTALLTHTVSSTDTRYNALGAAEVSVSITDNDKSDNANLSSMLLSKGTLTPDFSPAVTSYHALVPHSVSSITVKPSLEETHASVTVNGVGVGDGQDSQPILLGVGSNQVTAEVTAEDGVVKMIYLVTVTRNEPGLPPTPPTASGILIPPDEGGTLALGNEVEVEIPPGAIDSSIAVEVKVAKVTEPPEAPSGFSIIGNTYEFSVGGETTYDFAQPVTLTFTFDPASLRPGQQPQVFYYDAANNRWVGLGGTVVGNTITISIDHFTIFAVMAGASVEPSELTDISGHWAKSDIETLVRAGVVAGYPDGTFRPDDPVTRAEFVKLLVKALRLEPSAPGAGKFFDDTLGHWAEGYIATVYARGVVEGYSEHLFGPDDPVTREQMAAMVARATDLPVPVTWDLAARFSDHSSISDWASAAVAAAIEAGVMKGDEEGTFRPGAFATRAEAAVVLLRAFPGVTPTE